MEIRICKDRYDLGKSAAKQVAEDLKAIIASKGSARIALSRIPVKQAVKHVLFTRSLSHSASKRAFVCSCVRIFIDSVMKIIFTSSLVISSRSCPKRKIFQ